MTLNNFRKALTFMLAVSLVGGACKMARADAQADTLSGFNATADVIHSANPYIQAATSINIGAPTINLAGEQNNGGNFTVGGNTTVNVTGALNTSGVTTANGGATVNNGAAIHSGSGVGNGVTVAASQVGTVNGNAVSYGTAITGGSLVNGSMGVNGNINSFSGSGNSVIQVANNGLSIAGDSATLLVTNATTGATHGLSIDQQQTVLSGGTHSTTLTLDDGGATFAGQGGIPARVKGVADGVDPFDATNVQQLNQVKKTAYSGIASVAALAAIPAPAAGNNFSVGMGYGNYAGENAMAVGIKARVLDNVMVSAGMGYGTSEIITPNAGIGYSF